MFMKKFFPQRAVSHWYRMLRETVDAAFLEAFKASLDGAAELVGDSLAQGRGVGIK